MLTTVRSPIDDVIARIQHGVRDIHESSTFLFFANSRTLMGCTDPLKKGVGVSRQCPLGSVARDMIYADVRVHILIMLTGT